jgi:hypothetical protein
MRARREGATGGAGGAVGGWFAGADADVATPSEVSVDMSPPSPVILIEGATGAVRDDYASSGLPGVHAASNVDRVVARIDQRLGDLP